MSPAGGPLREYRPGDRDDLYAVCLRTGDAGRDATALHHDPRLLGEVWVGPYVELEPDLAIVLDDGAGAEGYVLGALDTRSFERRRDAEWMPHLRQSYPLDAFADGSADDGLVQMVHRPMTAPDEVVRDHPSHLHIDLLPRWQGGGWGRRLIDELITRLVARGSTGVFLGVDPRNEPAIGFYRHLGFDPVGPADGPWLGRRLV